ncbi:MAG: TMEM165/GDT1 family protein [Deltaproteobacteria bacterium]|nr:TMEM165/GDT1 family protein [Deltaproteobacteria bacterium]
MTVFIASFLFVVLAEMGDKTQLLAMAFATRFPAKTVLAGVLVATLLNHLLAVVLGSWLTNLVPLDVIQIAASASFILFGLWTLRGDKLEGEDKKYRFSPFWTVAVAFFFAEMGDKTQLATVALAAKYHSILPIWMGTTAGMMVADAFGIIVGVVLGKKIPDRFVKWFAATIFILFGIAGLYDSLPESLLTPPVAAGGLLLIVLLTGLVAGLNYRRKSQWNKIVRRVSHGKHEHHHLKHKEVEW